MSPTAAATHAALPRKIHAQGYSGGSSTVCLYVRLLKTDAVPPPPHRPVPQPRKVTRWIFIDPDHLHADTALELKQIRAARPELEATVQHVRDVATMMRHLHGNRRLDRIDAVRDDDLPYLRQFTGGLAHDLDAVTAGLTLRWNSGQAEGQNTRVKLSKRAGYGRANFDLLRKRTLLQT